MTRPSIIVSQLQSIITAEIIADAMNAGSNIGMALDQSFSQIHVPHKKSQL